jgi:hypothetical protein
MDEETMDQDDFEAKLRRELRDRFPAPPFPGNDIEEQIRSTLAKSRGDRVDTSSTTDAAPVAPRWWRSTTARMVLAVAASLLLFIGGAEYGRRTALPYTLSTSTPATAVETYGSSPAFSIQDAGSQYVASLARFSGESRSLSPRQRRVAREVALATIYGATLELLRESSDDEMLKAVVKLVVTRREQFGADTLAAPKSN